MNAIASNVIMLK